MRKHTPGPWSIYFNSQDDLVIRKLFADGHESHAVARCHSGIDNALLIAAAPELLAVLKAALPLLHTSDELPMNYFADKPGVLGEALRIIAKIEGELK